MRLLISTFLVLSFSFFGCEDPAEELPENLELCFKLTNDLGISFPNFSIKAVDQNDNKILLDTVTNFDVKNCLLVPKNKLVALYFIVKTSCEEFSFEMEIGPFTETEDIEIVIEKKYLGTQYEEKIFQGDKVLTNQEELEAFGSNNYTVVNGDLKLSGISSLCPLKSLRTVTDDLMIGYYEYDYSPSGVVYRYEFDNPNLKSLIGINNLDSVGGNLLIQLNAIDSIGFLKLHTIGVLAP